MLRAQMHAGTPLGIKAKSFIEKGELVPDDVIIDMVVERIAQPDSQNGFMLDGFPRTVAQADALAAAVDIDAAINIAVPAEKLVNRIAGRRMCRDCGATHHVSTLEGDTCCKCGGQLYIRKDDNEETVRNRLSVYTAQTEPLLGYYKAKGVLHNFDGDRPIDDVFADISTLLVKFV
jgi:adenylate kinase